MNSLRAILKKREMTLSGLVIHRGWLYQPGIFYSRKYIRMF